MLTNSDLKLNFFSFRLCSLLSIYGIHFRRFEERASGENVRWRKLLFKFWQGLVLTHWLYIILRTLYAALFTNPNWIMLCFIICIILVSATFICFMYIFFEKNIGLGLKLFNEILEIRDELSAAGVSGGKTLPELVLCHSVTLLASSTLIYPVLYALDMDAMYLIISCVPSNWRNPGVILLCLTMEMIPQAIYLLWLNHTLYMLLSFILTFEQYAQWNISQIIQLEHSTPSPLLIESKIKAACAVLHRLNLYLKFFNLGASKALFLGKQLCLAIGIGAGFFAIKLSRTSPAMAFIYCVLFSDAVTFPTAVFSLTYGVTTSGEKLKRVMLRTSRLLPSKVYRRGLERRLKAVGTLCVSVGGFYQAERESVLIFLNFVVHQIVGLLVAF